MCPRGRPRGQGRPQGLQLCSVFQNLGPPIACLKISLKFISVSFH